MTVKRRWKNANAGTRICQLTDQTAIPPITVKSITNFMMIPFGSAVLPTAVTDLELIAKLTQSRESGCVRRLRKLAVLADMLFAKCATMNHNKALVLEDPKEAQENE